MTTTFSSRASSDASARLIASTSVICANVLSVRFELRALRFERSGKCRVQMIEHCRSLQRWSGEILLHRSQHALVAFLVQGFFFRSVPCAEAPEVRAHAYERLFLPCFGDFVGTVVTPRGGSGHVRGQAVRQRFDQRRSPARARFLEGTIHDEAHRNEVVPVDLFTCDARCKSLLSERLGGRLLGAR